jgi:hypothetical protein
MTKKEYYFHLVIAFITIFVAAIFTVKESNMTYATAQIESNSTSTMCINGKRAATTNTICLINQPCHTVRSDSTNVDDNSTDDEDDDNNNVTPMSFSQGAIWSKKQ